MLMMTFPFPYTCTFFVVVIVCFVDSNCSICCHVSICFTIAVCFLSDETDPNFMWSKS